MNFFSRKLIKNIILAFGLFGMSFSGTLILKEKLQFKATAQTINLEGYEKKGSYEILDRFGKKIDDITCFKDKKTGAHIIYKNFSESDNRAIKSAYNKLTVLWPPQDDAGISHDMEHLIAHPVQKKVFNKFFKNSNNPVMTESDFSAFTDRFGIHYKLRKEYFKDDFFSFVFDEYNNPTFLTENSKLFEDEVKGRAYNEIVNSFVKENSDDVRFAAVRNYLPGGIPKYIRRLSKEKLKEQFYSNVNPSNIILFLNSSEKNDPTINSLMNSFKNRLDKFNSSYLKGLPKGVKKQVNLGQYNKNIRELDDYITRNWSSDSDIFRRTSLDDGAKKNYNFFALVDIDVSDLSAKEKDVLALNSGAFVGLLRKQFKDKGIESFGSSPDSLLYGSYKLWFASNNSNFFDKNNLISTVKDIFGGFVKKYEEIKKESKKSDPNFFADFNNYLGKGLSNDTDFLFNDKNENLLYNYRNIYSIDNLILYSLSKYGEPFSDKVFDIEKKFDSATGACGVILDTADSIKQNVSEENTLNVIKKLKDINKIDITVFKKNNKQRQTYDLLYEIPIRYKANPEKPFYNRFAEYLIIQNLEKSTKSMRYTPILFAPFNSSSLRCYTNKSSRKKLNSYISNNLQNIKNDLISHLTPRPGHYYYDINYLVNSFIQNLNNKKNIIGKYNNKINATIEFLKRISKQIDEAVTISNRKEGLTEEEKNRLLKSSVSLILDSYNLYNFFLKMFESSELFFENQLSYEAYEREDKKYKNWFSRYFSEYDNKDYLGKEFLKKFNEYIEFKQKICTESLNEIDKILKFVNRPNIKLNVNEIRKETKAIINSYNIYNKNK